MIIKKRDKKNAMNKLLLVGFILTGLLSLFLLRYVAAQEGGGGGDNYTNCAYSNNSSLDYENCDALDLCCFVADCFFSRGLSGWTEIR